MLINKTSVMQVVKIVRADGMLDSVNIQPRGRIILPAGATIDPQMYSSYKHIAGIDRYAPPTLSQTESN